MTTFSPRSSFAMNLAATDDLTGGEWRTINGAHVYIRDGVAIAGPHHLMGKTVQHIEEHGRAPGRRKGFHAIERNAKGDYVGTKNANGEIEHHPEHAERLKRAGIAGGYHHVHLNEDENAPLQAVVKDSKGKSQYKYSADHSEKAAVAKWARAKRLSKDLPAIREKLRTDTTEEGAALRLIDHTGFRIGGERDTGTDEPHYGATTLHADHISANKNGGATAKFIGKKGVENIHEINHPEIAKDLLDRARRGGKLFDTTDAKVRQHLDKIAPEGNDYLVKDLRTHVANVTANNAMKGMPAPTNAKELESSIKAVSEVVAKKLGNTASVARKDYISPETFAPWHSKVSNIEQASLVSKYAQNRGMESNVAAKEWIGKHAADYRQEFKGRTLKQGKNSSKIGKLQESKYLSRGVAYYERPHSHFATGRTGNLRPRELRSRTNVGGNGGSFPPGEGSRFSRRMNLAAGADLGGRWITLNGSDNVGEGTHVFISGGGTILKGPHALTGKHITRLGKEKPQALLDSHKKSIRKQVDAAVKKHGPAKVRQKLVAEHEVSSATLRQQKNNLRTYPDVYDHPEFHRQMENLKTHIAATEHGIDYAEHEHGATAEVAKTAQMDEYRQKMATERHKMYQKNPPPDLKGRTPAAAHPVEVGKNDPFAKFDEGVQSNFAKQIQGTPKEPWQMTRDEYHRSLAGGTIEHTVTSGVNAKGEKFVNPKHTRTVMPLANFKTMLTKGKPGSVHWKKKSGRDHQTTAMFSAVNHSRFAMNLSADGDGHWLTINGNHVFVKGGIIAMGPKHMQGKSLATAYSNASGEHAKLAQEHGMKAYKAKSAGNHAEAEQHQAKAAEHSRQAKKFRDQQNIAMHAPQEKSGGLASHLAHSVASKASAAVKAIKGFSPKDAIHHAAAALEDFHREAFGPRH